MKGGQVKEGSKSARTSKALPRASKNDPRGRVSARESSKSISQAGANSPTGISLAVTKERLTTSIIAGKDPNNGMAFRQRGNNGPVKPKVDPLPTISESRTANKVSTGYIPSKKPSGNVAKTPGKVDTRRASSASISAPTTSRLKAKSVIGPPGIVKIPSELDSVITLKKPKKVLQVHSEALTAVAEALRQTSPRRLGQSKGADSFVSLPTKVQKLVFAYLSPEDFRNCRLVNQRWHNLVTPLMKFHMVVTDKTRHLLRNVPSLEKLIVTRVTTGNMTSFENSLFDRGNVFNYRIKSLQDVKVLDFTFGTSELVQTKLLAIFQWIEKLSYLKLPFPSLPHVTGFSVLKTLEIRAKDFYSGQTLEPFFDEAQFPVLQRLRLEFYTRNDLLAYLGAHYFVARHWRTLRSLVLNFGYYLSDLNGFAKDSDKAKLPDISQVREFKADKRYQKYLDLIFKSILMEVEIDLSINEGISPWSLSLELLDSQTRLQKLTVRHPFHLRHYDFYKPLKNNSGTLTKVSIPCVSEFDCSGLEGCTKLRSLSIGKEFSFNNLFFGSWGTITKFAAFPRLETLRTVSISTPLSKSQIMWMSSNIPAHSFLLFGAEKETYRCNEILDVMEERPVLRKLMMRICMSEEENEALHNYLANNDDLILMDYFYEPNSSATSFSIESGREFEMDSDNIERLYLGSDTGSVHDLIAYNDPEIDLGYWNSRRPPHTA